MTNTLPPHLASLAEKLAEEYKYSITGSVWRVESSNELPKRPGVTEIDEHHKQGFLACYQALSERIAELEAEVARMKKYLIEIEDENEWSDEGVL